MGIVCFIILYYLATRKKDKLPDGALFALFLIIFWTLRFCIEFVKENQIPLEESSILTMGQFLSIPLVLAGIVLLWYVYRKKNRTNSLIKI
jgi:phosphatidylglycerol---prolipoprotein diacylglyceryl transferase